MSTSTPFCTDVDLLEWEPNLLREAAFVSQTLLFGDGILSGTSFTITGGSLITAGAQVDQVLVLGEPVNGCFAIMSIDSATALTLSVMHAGMAGDTPQAKAPPTSGTIPYVIRTFWAQRIMVSELLGKAAGAGSARPGDGQASIVNPQSLRRACGLGTLQMIYSALAAASPDEAQYAVRAAMYERLYRQALRTTTVDIDLDGDGEPEARRMLSVLNFRRD